MHGLLQVSVQGCSLSMLVRKCISVYNNPVCFSFILAHVIYKMTLSDAQIFIWLGQFYRLFYLLEYVQCESKKIPPNVFWHFFRNGWEFFVQISHLCYMFLSTRDCKFLFNYLQLSRSYATLSMAYAVHIICAKCPPSAETHADILWHFPQTVRNF